MDGKAEKFFEAGQWNSARNFAGSEIAYHLSYIARSQFLWPSRSRFSYSSSAFLNVLNGGFRYVSDVRDFSQGKSMALAQAQCFTAIGLGPIVL